MALLSALGLVISNLVAVWFALRDGWGVPELMTLYWCQSVFIGGFTFLRILSFRQFDPSGIRINGQPIGTTKNSQFEVGFFFLVHFGLFHMGYYAVLATEFPANTSQALAVLVSATLFLGHHFFSFLQQHAADVKSCPSLSNAMFFPYARVLPMHLLPLLGPLLGPVLGRAGIGVSEGQSVLIAFVTLKIVADLAMHVVEAPKKPVSQGGGAEEAGEMDSPLPTVLLTSAGPAAMRWRLLGVVMMVVGGLFLWMASPRLVDKLWRTARLEGVEVPCTILERSVVQEKKGGEKRVALRYAYRYEGKDYEGTLPNPWQRTLAIPCGKLFKAISDSSIPYEAGMKTVCYVKPRAPERAVLSLQPPSVSLAGTLVLSLLPLMLFVGGWMVWRPSARVEARAG